MAQTAAIIINIVKTAYDTALEVKANKRRCRRLGERLHALIGPLGNLQDDERATDKENALKQTLAVVREAESLIKKYQHAKWYGRAIGAALGTHKGDFEEINERLQGCVEALQFGMITETMFAVRDDRDDEQKDLFENHATLEAMLAVQGRPPQEVAAMEDELSAVDARLQQLGENISENLCRLGSDAEEGRADIIAAVKEGQADMIARLEAIEAQIGRSRGRRRGVEARDARSRSFREQQHTLHEIKRSELIETDVILGKGAFGVVRAATWGSCQVALKQLDVLSSVFAASAREELKKEAIVHQSLSHPNILAFYGFCPENLSLVIERSFGGSLAARLYAQPTRSLAPALVLAYVSDILGGLTYLHDFGVFHRDLKSWNLLICVGGVIKLADFGLAKVKEASSTLSASATGRTASSLGKGPGTCQWMAPERLKPDGTKPRWREADVYALGVVCYELCTCSPPWAGKIDAQIITAVVYENQRPEIPDTARAANPVIVELLEQFWAHDPIARPVLAEGWVQRRVASALETPGGDPRRFRELGAIPLLVELGMSGSDRAKRNVARVLSQLACNDENKKTIAKAGAIPVLVKLVEGGNDNDAAREWAAGTLQDLAVNDENKISIANAGAIPVLVKLAKDGTDGAKTRATGALLNLACNSENQIAIANAGAIPVLIELAEGGNDAARENAAGAMGNLAVNAENQIAIAKAGAIPVLVKLTKDGNDAARKNAPGALAYLAVNAENKIAIAKAGAIPVLVKVARDGDEEARENAAAALSNLALNDENKIAIAKAGAIPVLVKLARDGNEEARMNAAAALLDLACNSENKIAIAKAGAIPVLVKLARDENEEAREKAAAALWNLAANAENQIAIAKAGAIPVLVKLAKDGNEEAREKAAAVLWNLAANAESQIAIAKAGAIPVLVKLAKDGNDAARKNAAGVLGNLAVNAENQIAIAKAGAIPVLVKLTKDGNDAARKNAAGALWNLSVNTENKIAIAMAGAIPAGAIPVLTTNSRKKGRRWREKKAAGALWNLACNDDENQIAIAKAGAIPVLVKLAKDGNDAAREKAAGALWNLAINDENNIAIAKAGAIPVLTKRERREPRRETI
ncbi:hypothetical protein CTAYLR_008006 [Chrysophaeum taylorii]|uniref:Protein kinase domain-containing protein n=1 Tax=Chrysophaeum taylorii TaxID=2483200 RepID=A0AAD7U8P6_9STRA|nr:hypothetical protein CTAYLR_008006 [Chrysophaeum taylorii]